MYPESDDMIAAAKWLAEKPYIDSKKVGIWGWSYGGFMSSLCIGSTVVVKELVVCADLLVDLVHILFNDSGNSVIIFIASLSAVSYTHLCGAHGANISGRK